SKARSLISAGSHSTSSCRCPLPRDQIRPSGRGRPRRPGAAPGPDLRTHRAAVAGPGWGRPGVRGGACTGRSHTGSNPAKTLERIYVQADERLVRPKVRYIEVIGKSLASDPTPVVERIEP